jgi:hypothetical protein
MSSRLLECFDEVFWWKEAAECPTKTIDATHVEPRVVF